MPGLCAEQAYTLGRANDLTQIMRQLVWTPHDMAKLFWPSCLQLPLYYLSR